MNRQQTTTKEKNPTGTVLVIDWVFVGDKSCRVIITEQHSETFSLL